MKERNTVILQLCEHLYLQANPSKKVNLIEKGIEDALSDEPLEFPELQDRLSPWFRDIFKEYVSLENYRGLNVQFKLLNNFL